MSLAFSEEHSVSHRVIRKANYLTITLEFSQIKQDEYHTRLFLQQPRYGEKKETENEAS